MTALQQLSKAAEFKFSGTPGTFEGYAAVFGNVDGGGDVIAPGAFKDYQRTRDNRVLVLLQHSMRDPIGKADVSQDTRGLHVRGALAVDDPTAARAYGLMKSGLLDSMSIGFEIRSGGAQYVDGVRMLTDLKLYEVSIVTMGMNDLARVDAVKTAADCAHVRELEHLLRENPYFALSRRKATAAASALWPILTAERDAQGDARDERADFVAIAKTLDQLSQQLKGYK